MGAVWPRLLSNRDTSPGRAVRPSLHWGILLQGGSGERGSSPVSKAVNAILLALAGPKPRGFLKKQVKALGVRGGFQRGQALQTVSAC